MWRGGGRRLCSGKWDGETLKTTGMKVRGPHRRGEWAELRFMAKAVGLGFRLTKPVGNYEPYDVGIDLGGGFVRVQVKSSSVSGRAGNPSYRSGYFAIDLRRRSRRPYQRLDFDFLAVYVVPFDIWYIIPATVATRIYGIRVCPGNLGSKYERYREAWDLIDGPGAAGE